MNAILHFAIPHEPRDLVTTPAVLKQCGSSIK